MSNVATSAVEFGDVHGVFDAPVELAVPFEGFKASLGIPGLVLSVSGVTERTWSELVVLFGTNDSSDDDSGTILMLSEVSAALDCVSASPLGVLCDPLSSIPIPTVILLMRAVSSH